jgi:hypothetical protein
VNFALEGTERICMSKLAREEWTGFATVRTFEPDAKTDAKALEKADYYKEMANHFFAVCFFVFYMCSLGVFFGKMGVRF